MHGTAPLIVACAAVLVLSGRPLAALPAVAGAALIRRTRAPSDRRGRGLAEAPEPAPAEG